MASLTEPNSWLWDEDLFSAEEAYWDNLEERHGLQSIEVEQVEDDPVEDTSE